MNLYNTYLYLYTKYSVMTFKPFFTSLLLLTVSFQGISQDLYTKNWREIDSLEKKGLFNMALKNVNTLFLKAIKSQNHEQVIKSVFYELKYNTYLKEDDYVLGIHNLENLIKQTPSPAKEILHSLTAEVYWGYYSANSWKYSQRTSVQSKLELNDLRTWDLKRIADKVIYHYQQSLKNETVLQSEPIENYKTVIQDSEDTKEFRPTLFDFLGHRAIQFFNNNSFNVPGSAVTYTMNTKDYFGSSTTFSQLDIKSPDKYNTTYYGSLFYQNLTTFRLTQPNKTALFQLELDRIKYANSKSVSTNKDELYEEALTRLATVYSKNPYVSEALYLIAEIHNTKGDDYSYPDNVQHK